MTIMNTHCLACNAIQLRRGATNKAEDKPILCKRCLFNWYVKDQVQS